MATTEKVGLFTHVDDNGNTTLLYPVTKMEAVDGLPEAVEKSVQKSSVVNNFTTTEKGFVADARALKVLNDKLRAAVRVSYNGNQLTVYILDADEVNGLWFQYSTGSKRLAGDVKIEGNWVGEYTIKQY